MKIIKSNDKKYQSILVFLILLHGYVNTHSGKYPRVYSSPSHLLEIRAHKYSQLSGLQGIYYDLHTSSVFPHNLIYR